MKKNHLKLEYDKAVDAAYLTIRKGKIMQTEQVKPGLIVDFDAKQQILGIEILHFARRFMSQTKAVTKAVG